MMAARPEKSAPTTKYGPKMVLRHIGFSVIAKSHDTIVCTETAMGRMVSAISDVAFSRRTHSRSVPRHPAASVRYIFLRQPSAFSRATAMSGIIVMYRYMRLAVRYVLIAMKSHINGDWKFGHKYRLFGYGTIQ